MANLRILSTALAGALLLGATGTSLSASRDSDLNNEQEAWMGSEVTSTDAATIAERATGGEAVRVSYDYNDWGGPNVYRVDTREATEISQVEIDADSGAVLGVTNITEYQRQPSEQETLKQVPQPGPSNPSM